MGRQVVKRVVRDLIVKHALRNAIEHGEANPKAVLGKVLAERPELKKEVSRLLPLLEKVVREVNALPPAEREIRIQEYTFQERDEVKKEGLPELEKRGEEYVFRFAPNPSGPLHLGHCRAAILNDLYTRRYHGRLILRYEDTDPARVDPEAYERIREDLEWLGVEVHETVFQSDRLEIYYDHACRLLEMGRAYVCTCSPEEFQKLRRARTPCPCREQGRETNLERYARMFEEYREGEVVIRMKTDLALPDPSMRDFPLLRIGETPHPRAPGRRVFPLMNFSVAIDDHLLGLTHVLRGKDHIANTRKQAFLYEAFGWEPPTYLHYGLLKIEGLELSTSAMAEGIRQGKFSGWDDLRLGTLRAMRRRGIQPEAIRKVMEEVGVKESDISFSWKNLYASNKAFIEDRANRYFFVSTPVLLQIEGCRTWEFSAPLHPNHPERGKRTLRMEEMGGLTRVFLSRKDADDLQEGEVFRLMEAFNVEVREKRYEGVLARFHSRDLEVARKERAKLLQWVSKDRIPVRLLTPTGVEEGYGEEGLSGCKAGEILQFERVGFVRIDAVGEKIIACFAHR
jgi:glutamyl-tRNA synthetase